MVQSGVFYISQRWRGPPNVAGPEVAYPLSHPLDGPVLAHWSVRQKLNRINSVQLRRSVRALTDRRLKPVSKLIGLKRKLPELWPSCIVSRPKR